MHFCILLGSKYRRNTVLILLKKYIFIVLFAGTQPLNIASTIISSHDKTHEICVEENDQRTKQITSASIRF